MEDIPESSAPPPPLATEESEELLSRRNGGDSVEEEQVVSKVHLGCPPGFSGPHSSHFTFSVPPGSLAPPWKLKKLRKLHCFVAADVIYSDDLTHTFFSTPERLMCLGSKGVHTKALEQPIVLYLALEKRYNFSLDDLDVVANGYLHFRSYLQDEKDCEGTGVCSMTCFVGKRIDITQIPQFEREYERGDDVEIWQIKYNRRILTRGL